MRTAFPVPPGPVFVPVNVQWYSAVDGDRPARYEVARDRSGIVTAPRVGVAPREVAYAALIECHLGLLFEDGMRREGASATVFQGRVRVARYSSSRIDRKSHLLVIRSRTLDQVACSVRRSV